MTNQPPLNPRLADVVSARLALSRLLNVSSSSPWVCFGGSYAGSLAAWARLKVPGLRWARGVGAGALNSGSLSQVLGTPSPHPLPLEGLSAAGFTRVRCTEGGTGLSPGPQLTTSPPQFPHLVFAAVASSAPVRAVLDFSAYNEVRRAGCRRSGASPVGVADAPLLPRSGRRWCPGASRARRSAGPRR